MDKCVFAGTFDPITLGHIAIIEKAAMLFDEVVVAMGINAQKKPYFSKEKRLKMLELALKRYKNVKFCSFDGMLADFMKSQNAVYYVRGIRNDEDYEYEERSFKVNSSLNPDIQTMLFPCPPEYKKISSHFVKELLAKGKSVEKYVPNEILELLT